MSRVYRFSVSALNMLFRCGEQYRRRYIEGHKIPPGIALLIGRATDTSVNADLGNKIQTGELLPDAAIADIARDSLMTEWDRSGEVVLDEEHSALGLKGARGAAVDTSVTLARLHHTEAAPKIAPTHVQRKFELDVAGEPIQISGVIDIQEGTRSIRDTKTSKRSPQQNEADRSLQLTAYALAVRQCEGKIPDKVVMDYLVHTKEPKLIQIESVRNDESLNPFLERTYQAYLTVKSGLFTPAPADAWFCDSRWCGWWHTCPYALRPVSVAVPTTISQQEPVNVIS